VVECAVRGGREALGARMSGSWRGRDVALAVGFDARSERCLGARAEEIGRVGRPSLSRRGLRPVSKWNWTTLSSGPGLVNLFQYSNYFPIAFNWSVLQKYKKGTSKVLQISKHWQAVDKFKRNNFPFGKDFKSPTEFELKIQEVICI
jgi:hypothetical protein